MITEKRYQEKVSGIDVKNYEDVESELQKEYENASEIHITDYDENVEGSSFMSELENGNEGKKRRKSGEIHSNTENRYRENVSNKVLTNDEDVESELQKELENASEIHITDDENVEDSSFMSEIENSNKGNSRRQSGETHVGKDKGYSEKASELDVTDNENTEPEPERRTKMHL